MKVLFNITHGFQARMLLRTQIAERLRERGADIIVVSPNAKEEYFRAEFEPSCTLEPMPERYPVHEKVLVSIRQFLLMNPSLGATLNFKRERYRKNYPLFYAAARAGNVFLGNIPVLREGYFFAEKRIFDGAEFDELLTRHAPDLVVTGTPGFNVYDAHLLRAARRRGIHTATVMLSWDNLTSKGYMGAQPDTLFVWSPLMAEEARQYHDFEGDIVEVGAAQFDIYRRALDEDAGPSFLDARVPKGQRLVVWGTINEAIYPDQIEPLKRFKSWIEARDDIHLWVRIHPQSVVGPFAHMREKYEALASPRTTIELPDVQSKRLSWDLPKADMWHLASLLHAASCVVVPRSTLSIDAACVDTPVINLALDEAFARGFNYTHYRKLVETDGVVVARSFQQVTDEVAHALAHPEAKRRERQAIVAQQLGAHFGSAGRRTGDAIADLAAR